MPNTNNFNIIGLDFNDAKASLKAFLQSQDTLKDYNFDGSVLSTVLDVLAYNTHYQAFYANMVANEMFLDSALLRPSVVSHAKTIGYVPTSRRAAKAILGVSAAGSSETTYLSRGSEFLGTDPAGTQYRFVLLDTVYADSDTQSFQNITVYEGILRRMSYVYDPTKRTGSYLLIPNDKIDTSTIRVRVKSSATDNTGMEDAWSYTESYIDLTPTSKVFFLQERETGMYELFFGDNFLGKQPEAGNIVIVEYLETNGDVGNGINRFSTSISGLGNITVVSPSSGGSLEESVSKIKFLAPRFYQSQNRAVTESDYTSAVMKEYPNAASVYVYGGETVNPPQYGKVFIAIKPNSGLALTSQEKKTLTDTLRKTRSVLTVTPEIVDPDYIDVIFDSVVTIDPNKTAIGIGTLKALIVAYIYTYSANSLESFGSNLYLSKVVQGINSLNGSILSNQTTIKLRKLIDLSTLTASKGFVLDFKNPLSRVSYGEGGRPPQMTTSEVAHRDKFGVLYQNVTGVDDGNGTINLVTTDQNGNRKLVYQNIGTIDYDAGVIRFSTNFNPVGGFLFTVTVEPRYSDLFVFENKIFKINRGYSDSVNVSVVSQNTRKNTL
jgi:hypothetical protein